MALFFSRVKNMVINEEGRDKMNLEYGKPEGHTLPKDRGDWFEPSKMASVKKGKPLASLPSLFFFFFACKTWSIMETN